MNVFDDQIKAIRQIQEEIIQESFRNVISRFGFVLKDFIVNKQLFQEGIDGQGKKLRGYARTTIRIKISNNQPVDRTTLHDKEDFVKSIIVEDREDEFHISSDVSHDKYIIEKYGKEVLSPTTENMKEFMENYFLPKLKENVNNKIN